MSFCTNIIMEKQLLQDLTTDKEQIQVLATILFAKQKKYCGLIVIFSNRYNNKHSLLFL